MGEEILKKREDSSENHPPDNRSLLWMIYGIGICLMISTLAVSDLLFDIGLIIALIAFLAIAVRERSSMKPFLLTIYELPLLIIFIMALQSIIPAVERKLAVSAVIELLMGLLSFYLVRFYVSAAQVNLRHKALYIPFFLLILSALFQLFSSEYSQNIIVASQGGDITKVGRLTSFFSSPNLFASYIILVLPILAADAFSGTWKERFLPAVLTVSGFLCLILTFSRNGWLSFCGAVMVTAFLTISAQRRRVFLVLLGTVLSLLLLCYLAYPQRIASYFFHRGSDTGRVIIYQKSFAIMKDHMWLGVGAGNFRIAFPRYCTNEEYGIVASPPPWHAHSVPLNLAVETGIISAVAWIAFLFLIISGLVRALRRHSPDRAYIAGLLTGILAFTFFSLIDCSLNDHRCGFAFFLIAGLAAGHLCAVGEQGGTGEYNH